MPIFAKLQETRFKLAVARLLYQLIRPFAGKGRKVITRNKLKFEVDLSEGIDLSLFLFGSFQRHVTEIRGMHIPENGIIIDVGANIGVTVLNYARQVPQGKVYAFEPTHYALSKLRRNLELNPELGQRIEIINSFVSESSTVTPDLVAYSSWKVDGSSATEAHPIHGGTPQDATEVPAVSLDDFCRAQHLSRLDLIKIDTDGHEYGVLAGARQTMRTLRPTIIFEAVLSLMEERGHPYEQFAALFAQEQYDLFDAASGQGINLDNYQERIPRYGGIDILAIPKPR
jgi:FkbM family methyltransferase